MRPTTPLAWPVITCAIALGWYAIEVQKPPLARSIDAPSDVFAAGRAQKHVEALTRAPHPMGSDEAQYVRGVLIQKLTELGLAPTIQAPKRSNSPAKNVIARLQGQGPSGKKALMLCTIMIPFRPALVLGMTPQASQ